MFYMQQLMKIIEALANGLGFWLAKRSNFFEKTIDTPLWFWDIGCTHGNTVTTTNTVK